MSRHEGTGVMAKPLVPPIGPRMSLTLSGEVHACPFGESPRSGRPIRDRSGSVSVKCVVTPYSAVSRLAQSNLEQLARIHTSTAPKFGTSRERPQKRRRCCRSDPLFVICPTSARWMPSSNVSFPRDAAKVRTAKTVSARRSGHGEMRR